MLTEYLDCRISFQSHNGDSYPFSIHAPGGDADSTLRLPQNDQDFQALLAKLANLSIEEEELIQIGQLLFKALFSGISEEVLRRSQGMLQPNQGLRIVLEGANDLKFSSLPWEFLFDPEEGPLALLDTSIVRFLPQQTFIPSLKTDLPLKILLTGAQPSDLPPSNVQRELEEIQAAVEGLAGRGRVHLVVEPHLTRTKFQRLLRDNFHVWHFAGQAGFKSDSGTGVLFFEDAKGYSDGVKPVELSILLNSTAIRLIVLAASGSGRLETAPFRTIAPALIRARIPAVIAMQFQFAGVAVNAFARELYSALVDGFPIDACVTEGRKAVMNTVGFGQPDWGIPIVYTRVPNGKLFDLPVLAITPQPQLQASTLEESEPSKLPMTEVTDTGAGPTQYVNEQISVLRERYEAEARNLHFFYVKRARSGLNGTTPEVLAGIEDSEKNLNSLGNQLHSLGEPADTLVEPQIEIERTRELLETYRQTLRYLLVQRATLGEAFTPPGTLSDIEDARRHITQVKSRLRELGVAVNDLPDDEEEQQTIAPPGLLLPPFESSEKENSEHTPVLSLPPFDEANQHIIQADESQTADDELKFPSSHATEEDVSATTNDDFAAHNQLPDRTDAPSSEQDLLVHDSSQDAAVSSLAAMLAPTLATEDISSADEQTASQPVAADQDAQQADSSPHSGKAGEVFDILGAAIPSTTTTNVPFSQQDRSNGAVPLAESDSVSPSQTAPETTPPDEARADVDQERNEANQAEQFSKSAVTPSVSDARPVAAISSNGAKQSPAASSSPASASALSPMIQPVVVTPQNLAIDIHIHQDYEPPPDDHTLCIDVGPKTVKLSYNKKKTTYSGPNLLESKQEELLAATLMPDEYGRLLFESIIHSQPSRGASTRFTTYYGYNQAIQQTNGDIRIELLLDAQTTDLHKYQWETLRQGNETPLALQARTPFYRYVQGGDKLTPLDPPLKILVAICNPGNENRAKYKSLQNLALINTDSERAAIEPSLQRLKQAGLAEYEIISDTVEFPLSFDRLRDRVRDGQFHVLHLLAHGLQLKGGYFVVIEQPGDKPFVPAREFKQALAGSDLRLVFLASCKSAQPGAGDSLLGLGADLALAGIPAVIAMQDDALMDMVHLLNQRFYDDLARSGRVDMAMNATRRALAEWVGGRSGAWATPVLYLSTPDAHLFKVDSQKIDDLNEIPFKDLSDPEASKANAASPVTVTSQNVPKPAARKPTADMASGDNAEPLLPKQKRSELQAQLQQRVGIVASKLKEFVEDPARGSALKLPARIYYQIAAALNAGKHIILTGPPGTGKTSLAHDICRYASDPENSFTTGLTPTTATADWTAFDTIGGYVPTPQQTLHFRPGIFLRAVCEGSWLVIDEINRAEIDKAFGELFTVLSGQMVEFPYLVYGRHLRILPPASSDPQLWQPEEIDAWSDYVVHPNWRIIATMNVYDKSSLYAMSLAFMRRFALIEVELPEDYAQLVNTWIDTSTLHGYVYENALKASLHALLDKNSILMRYRALGPAITKDMISYMASRYEPNARLPADHLLSEAFLLYGVPQLDGLARDTILSIYGFLHEWLHESANLLPASADDAREALLTRIEQFYPHVRQHEWASMRKQQNNDTSNVTTKPAE